MQKTKWRNYCNTTGKAGYTGMFFTSLMFPLAVHLKKIRLLTVQVFLPDCFTHFSNVLPCSLICRICFTVSFKIAHLSGLKLKLSISLKLAKISSASSSMYLFSCSRLRFSVLLLGLQNTCKAKQWKDSTGNPGTFLCETWYSTYHKKCSTLQT